MNKVPTQKPVAQTNATAGRLISLLLTASAAALLLFSLKLPLWHMRLEAPQYRGEEALRVAVHPNALKGDLRELKVLDQYIGVHVPPTLPQFHWLPATVLIGAMFGMAAVMLPLKLRRWALLATVLGMTVAFACAALQARGQIYQIGHNRDQHTPLAGVKDFTPPFLGTAKIAQFEVSSQFGLGAWLIGAALALQLGAAWSCRPRPAVCCRAKRSKVDVGLLTAAVSDQGT